MKIKLLRAIGSYGIILNPESALEENRVHFETEAGVLTIGKVSHRVKGGVVTFRECEIANGESKITFTSQSKEKFDCGRVTRSGRHISISCKSDSITAALASAYTKQQGEIGKIKTKLKEFEDKFGISII